MTKTKRYKMAAIMAISLFVISALVVAVPYSDADDSSFKITDTTGKEFTYSKPSDKVISFGYATSLTVAQCGQISKLYATDKYGKEAFGEFDYTYTGTEYVPCTGGNKTVLFDTIVQAKDDGKISFDDTIILSTYSANVADDGLRSKLEAVGFTHVLFYGTMVDYDAVVNCVKGICLACGGEDLSKQMTFVRDKVVDKLKENDNPKTDAIFIWNSATYGWGYGNTGSISVALMDVAGANNIGYNSESSSSIVYNKNDIIQRLGNSPNAWIFLDSAVVRDYIKGHPGATEQDAINDFADQVLGGSTGDHKVLIVKRTWNNYDADAADGIWNMACALHPDLFEGDVPSYKSDNHQNLTPLIIGAVAAVAVVAIGAVLIIRRH